MVLRGSVVVDVASGFQTPTRNVKPLLELLKKCFRLQVIAVYRKTQVDNETFTGIKTGVTAGAVASTKGGRGQEFPRTSGLVDSETPSHHNSHVADINYNGERHKM